MKKKVFTGVLILAAVLMFSSCRLIFWGWNTVTIYNDSSYTLYDVCVVDEYGDATYVSGDNIRSGRCKSITCLPNGYYYVYFQMGNYDAECTQSFSVYRDRSIHIRNYKDYDYIRSVTPDGNTKPKIEVTIEDTEETPAAEVAAEF